MTMPRCLKDLGWVVLLAISMSACSTPHQVVKTDPSTGLLPTDVEVKPEHIKVFTPSARVRDIKFMYVRAVSGGGEGYVDFLDKELLELGFPAVVHRDELTKLIIQSDLINSVGNVTDPVALAKLSKAIGPFLILDVAQIAGPYSITHTYARITDPETADVLLSIERVRNAWVSFDKEVHYPMLNVIKRWLEQSRALPRQPSKAVTPTT
ncbi:MAG: hypothetical protein ABIS07_11965 [Dokdonella sp.]